MVYPGGCRSSPPVWSCTDGYNHHPKGEVGTLKAVFRSETQPSRFFLLISYEESEYPRCLLFNDDAFCRQVMELLKSPLQSFHFCRRFKSLPRHKLPRLIELAKLPSQ